MADGYRQVSDDSRVAVVHVRELLSSMFANIEKLWIIYVFALSGIVSTLAVGLWLVRDNNRKGE